MGRGSRHSKNAGTMGSESMTYAEKRTLGYGTVYERLGKDSVGNFDDCMLTLGTATDPVCTPWGIIYSKEAILEYLIQQKKTIRRNLQIWEDFHIKERTESTERLVLTEQEKLAEFEWLNHSGLSRNKIKGAFNVSEDINWVMEHTQISVKGGVNINTNYKPLKEVKASWEATMTPEVGPTPFPLQEKPQDYTTCPVTGKKTKVQRPDSDKVYQVTNIQRRKAHCFYV